MVSLVISFSTANIYHSRRIVVFNELNKFKSLPFGFVNDEDIMAWASKRTNDPIILKEFRKELSMFRMVLGRKKTYPCDLTHDNANDQLIFTAYVNRTVKQVSSDSSSLSTSIKQTVPVHVGITRVTLHKPWYYLFKERLKLMPLEVNNKEDYHNPLVLA